MEIAGRSAEKADEEQDSDDPNHHRRTNVRRTVVLVPDRILGPAAGTGRVSRHQCLLLLDDPLPLDGSLLVLHDPPGMAALHELDLPVVVRQLPGEQEAGDKENAHDPDDRHPDAFYALNTL